jgi:hypothetical protein
MPELASATDEARTINTTFPFRRTIVSVESLVGLGGLAGSIQLLAGVATPPVSALSSLGLASWALPAGWIAKAPVQARRDDELRLQRQTTAALALPTLLIGRATIHRLGQTYGSTSRERPAYAR